MERVQIKAGAILSYLQMILSIAIGLFYTPVMIRLLGQSEYGLYSTAISVTAMLSILNLGFGSAYQRYYSKYHKIGDQIKIAKLNGMFLSIFSLLGLVAFCCGFFLVNHIDFIFDSGLTADEYKTAKELLAILIVQLALSFPTCVFTTIISAHERFVFSKSLQILKALLGPLLTLPMLLMGYKSIALVAVSLFVAILCDFLALYYVFFRLKERFKFGKIEDGLFRELLSYISFIALHLITDQINWNVDKILLVRFHDTSTTAVYSVGYSIYSYMIYFGTPISSMFVPRVHRITANYDLTISEKSNEYSKIFTKVGRIQFLLIGCIVTGFVVFGKQFIQLWVGDAYSSSYWVTLLLMIPGAIDLIQVIGTEIQRSQNLHKFRGIVYIIMAMVNVLLSIPLCIKWGAIGSAVGTAFSFVIVQGFIINIYLHKKCHVNIVYFWKSILRMSCGLMLPFILGEIAVRLFGFNSLPSLVAGIMGYCIVYVISMWFIGLNPEEKNLAYSMLRRFKARNKHQ